MTVARLRREMSNDELLRWMVFYARRRQIEELAAKRAQKRGEVSTDADDKGSD